MERGRTAPARSPAKPAAPANGILLALDGRYLDRPALPLALQLCRQYGKRLDILLVNPPKPATWMLGRFLQRLEEENVDYRLTSMEGELADELPKYVHRFRAISIILLDCLGKWGSKRHPTLSALRQEGYQVLTLLEREPDQAKRKSSLLRPQGGGSP